MWNISGKLHLLRCRWLVVTLIFVLIGAYFYNEGSAWAGDSSSPGNPNIGVLVGTWARTDGGYVIRVGDIKANGLVAAEYFNPRQIHVAEATASMQKKLVKLFIKLQDKGYQGSTYTLYYFAEKDALVGFYYQAAMDKTFEVIFLRKK